MKSRFPFIVALILASAAIVTATTYTATAPQDAKLTKIVAILAAQASPKPAPYADATALLADVCQTGFTYRLTQLQTQAQQNAQNICTGATAAQKIAACKALGQPDTCGLCN